MPMMGRALLLLMGLLVLGCLVGGPALAPPHADAAPKSDGHVILVVMGGGVRAKDIAHRERTPNLHAWSEEGVRVDGLSMLPATDGGGGEGAASDALLDRALVQLLSGHAEATGVGSSLRPAHATILDRCPGSWFVSAPSGDSVAPASHREIDAADGVQVACGAGAFGEPLAPFLESMGRPVAMSPKAWTLLEGLRTQHLSTARLRLPRSVQVGLPAFGRVERALLSELDRKASVTKGPAGEDARALRLARTVLRVYRPALTVIVLRQHDIGSVSENRYLRALRANDRGLAALRAFVAKDEVLGPRTTFVVVSDRGRATKADAQGRLLDAPAGTSQANTDKTGAVAILVGPRIGRGRVRKPHQLVDLARTVGQLAPGAARVGQDGPGRIWSEILRP